MASIPHRISIRRHGLAEAWEICAPFSVPLSVCVCLSVCFGCNALTYEILPRPFTFTLHTIAPDVNLNQTQSVVSMYNIMCLWLFVFNCGSCVCSTCRECVCHCPRFIVIDGENFDSSNDWECFPTESDEWLADCTNNFSTKFDKITELHCLFGVWTRRRQQQWDQLFHRLIECMHRSLRSIIMLMIQARDVI